jgi:hypothetical protein
MVNANENARSEHNKVFANIAPHAIHHRRLTKKQQQVHRGAFEREKL